jgi:acetyltransferase AlgX (SGNH hydrolase-like protein)
MNFLSRPILAATLLLFPGCRKQAPSSALNRHLIAILDARDRLDVKPDVKADAVTEGKPHGNRLAAKYVIQGSHGHLFYLEDLRAALVKADAYDASLALIARVSAALQAKGVRLLVVPVPTKVEIHPELLGGRNVPDLSDSKGRFLKGLDGLKVDYLDLRPAFFAAKDSVRLFPRTDTHWDQSAIRLAAALIAAQIAARVHPDGGPNAMAGGDEGLTDTALMGFRGDLAGKFDLADADTVRLQRVGDGRGGFLAEPDSAEVMLYGDSFLRQYSRYSAHLGAHLARELGSPVKTVYSLKGFIEGPERIRDLAEAYPRTRTVVWVFTSRSLMEVTF